MSVAFDEHRAIGRQESLQSRCFLTLRLGNERVQGR